MFKNNSYINNILKISYPYLQEVFSDGNRLNNFLAKVSILESELNTKKVIKEFIKIYIEFLKQDFQKQYKNIDHSLVEFLELKNDEIKIVWGDCLKVLKGMKSESIHLMVTSPPYYNVREYSKWNNLNDYLDEMRLVIRESYRVLDNHRVFVFNIGDIIDNDNIITTSKWGKRRIPLTSYLIKIFEEEGSMFIDDFIWDKGEIQSNRHQNNKSLPFYHYPINCYEHILIFHKHRVDNFKYPCPTCGCLKVKTNSYIKMGLKSWECNNTDCFERSKTNRGKRFTLKNLITEINEGNYEIDKELVKKWRRDIVKINPVVKINSKRENILGHTAPFPIEIPEFAIKMFSYPGEYVLDPFAGSFTSIIAAKKLKRIGIGIELNKELFRESIIKNITKSLYNTASISELNLL
jgi:DNA modification methylase